MQFCPWPPLKGIQRRGALPPLSRRSHPKSLRRRQRAPSARFRRLSFLAALRRRIPPWRARREWRQAQLAFSSRPAPASNERRAMRRVLSSAANSEDQSPGLRPAPQVAASGAPEKITVSQSRTAARWRQAGSICPLPSASALADGAAAPPCARATREIGKGRLPSSWSCASP